MLKKEISTVVAKRASWKMSFRRGSAVCQVALRQGCPPLRIAEPDISMSEDRTPSGMCTDFRASASVSESRSPSFCCPVWQVGQRRHPVATSRVAWHLISEDRALSCGCALLPKQILRCRLEERRLSYRPSTKQSRLYHFRVGEE